MKKLKKKNSFGKLLTWASLKINMDNQPTSLKK